MFHVVPCVVFIFYHNPSLWQIMIKYKCRNSPTAYFYLPYLFSQSLTVCVDYNLHISAIQGPCLRKISKIPEILNMLSLCIGKLRCAVKMTAKIQSTTEAQWSRFTTVSLYTFYILNPFVLPALLGCQSGLKQVKTVCHSVYCYLSSLHWSICILGGGFAAAGDYLFCFTLHSTSSWF